MNNPEILAYFLAALYSVQALNCGIHLDDNNQLKLTINKCIQNNKTFEDLWDITSMSTSTESQSASSSEEEPPVDSKMMQSFRSRRFSGTPMDVINSTDGMDEANDVVTENCIIHCIFDHLQLTDLNGYPEHLKLTENLLKNSNSRELSDFLQDTTDECFQEIDKETKSDPCSYSIKLVNCLAEKGKENCEDWPIGDLPLHP